MFQPSLRLPSPPFFLCTSSLSDCVFLSLSLFLSFILSLLLPILQLPLRPLKLSRQLRTLKVKSLSFHCVCVLCVWVCVQHGCPLSHHAHEVIDFLYPQCTELFQLHQRSNIAQTCFNHHMKQMNVHTFFSFLLLWKLEALQHLPCTRADLYLHPIQMLYTHHKTCFLNTYTNTHIYTRQIEKEQR